MTSLPFLLTRLYRPRLPAHQVPRPQLLARLHQGWAHGHPLTLVVAPAGFGKTTLVSQWLDDLRTPQVPALDEPQAAAALPAPRVAWLTLDEADNDLALFLRYVVAALQRVFPTACANTLSLVQAPQVPPVLHLAASLLQDLAALEQTCILTLEDYHLITDATIHQLLTRLLDHWPRRLHLILTSRTEPPLPLARLRVRQHVTELRAAHLYFSDMEAQAFLTHALGKVPAPHTVAALQTQTEGWVAGLQLAALALRNGADEQAFVHAFAHSSRHVMAYLLDEVLLRQPQAMQTWLLRISILERFCAPLCEALGSAGGERPDEAPFAPPPHTGAGQAFLDELTRTQLFLVPLDERGDWYRFHPLFRELLRHHLQTRISPAALAALHRQASAWLAAQGGIEEAVQQALAGGDVVAATHLVEQHRHALLNQQDFPTLKRWLALLPAEVAQRRPALLMAHAWLANAQGRAAAISALAQQAADGLTLLEPTLDEPAKQALRGELDAVWALAAYGQGDGPQVLAAAQQALTHVPVADTFVYSTVTFGVGLGYVLTGQPEQAVRFIQDTLAQTPHQTDLFRARLLFLLAAIQRLGGHLQESRQTIRGWLTVATAQNLALDLGWAYHYLGMIHYEWNELAAAQHHFSSLVALRYRAGAGAVLEGLFGLALTYQAQGQPAQAHAQIASAFALSTELQIDGLQNAIRSFQARLLLRQGGVAAAAHAMQAVTLAGARGLVDMLDMLELPHLTQVKALV